MTKTCSVCGDTIGQLNRSGMCKRCRDKVNYEKNKESKAARRKIYREENKESMAAKRKIYNDANKERRKIYNDDNKFYIAARTRVYNVGNRVHIAARRKIYREENKERIRVYNREHPRENRTYLLAFSDPDCYVWNKWFEGCEGHHIAWDEGVYIPESLHHSISHNMKTGHGMKEINRLAYNWLNDVCRTNPQTTLDIF